MKAIWLTCLHDRHTDDQFKAFKSQESAEEYILEMAEKWNWQSAEQNNQYGDWCMYISDDYYMMIEAIELVED